MEHGGQCVMMVSAPLMLELLAESLVILHTPDMEIFELLGKELANYNSILPVFNRFDNVCIANNLSHMQL